MRAKINGIEMTYAVSGPVSAPSVVLHHPLATNLSFWDEATAALEKTYRVIRFDARGHGATEAPKGRYDFKTLSQDVIMLMDHVGVKRAQFVGLSMGGMIGQFLGLDHLLAARDNSGLAAPGRCRKPTLHGWLDLR